MDTNMHTITVEAAHGKIMHWDAEQYDYQKQDDGTLRIMLPAGRGEVARFAPGQWVCVVDSRHMLGASS